jgi:hypothetical protein
MITWGQAIALALFVAGVTFYAGGRLVVWHVFGCCWCARRLSHAFTHLHNSACARAANGHRHHDEAGPEVPPGPPGDAHP